MAFKPTDQDPKLTHFLDRGRSKGALRYQIGPCPHCDGVHHFMDRPTALRIFREWFCSDV